MDIAAPIPFDNSYATLPARFFTRQDPVAVAAPVLLAANPALAVELGIEPDWVQSTGAARVFGGNERLAGADPLAQVYAGHQFGGWSPQLGDGRAVLLGEVVDQSGQRRDIQLKGAGRTPYSRGGDGRAWLGPVLREFVVSEAMHALGVPTTRALAAVATGELVHRETALPGAVLTRVAASHIRVGTFQFFAARSDNEALQALTDYAINRHFPDAQTPLDLLNGVVEKQARLIAHWMSFGFIHGVMNTDNMTISGETIDYGPCAYMDQYNPNMVYSSIDRNGRYAYSNQPDVAVWNLAQLATSLVPLMGERDAAIAAATQAVHRFSPLYTQHWQQLFALKLGISQPRPDDSTLIDGFLNGMGETGADFTNSFRALSAHKVPDNLQDWRTEWQHRLQDETVDPTVVMNRANPAFVARNHRVEQMIQAALIGDMEPFRRLNAVLATPYDDAPQNDDFKAPPKPDEIVHQTFCGT